ncbi:10628_t:CDS:2 [Funneliformis mosseae]|uniref:10628_t:CDS:1 n=1 Tax=Funneliformis mosseae TaxID=27381 RepID=A0A9N9F671_FUNMO|nr:10628_t:CDS:2 [Funneliformis mosseae]
MDAHYAFYKNLCSILDDEKMSQEVRNIAQKLLKSKKRNTYPYKKKEKVPTKDGNGWSAVVQKPLTDLFVLNNLVCSLSLVSKGCKSFAIDNHVWSQLALKRWEGKQGMKEIHSEPHEIWFRKAGTWKKVYGLIEQEAKRSKFNIDDLAETTWCDFYYKLGSNDHLVKQIG